MKLTRREAQKRNFFIFRMRGAIPLLQQFDSELKLDYEEAEAISIAYKALHPLLEKWNKERKTHRKNCPCVTCWTTRHPEFQESMLRKEFTAEERSTALSEIARLTEKKGE